MGIYLGSTEIEDVRLGDAQINKVCVGDDEIWPSGGGVAEWGTVKYYSSFSMGYSTIYEELCTVNSVDDTSLDAFLAQHPDAFDITFSYDSDRNGWIFNWEGDPIAPADMLATTGISVTLDAGAEWAEFSLNKSIVVDTTSPLTSVNLTQTEYNSMSDSSTYSIHGVEVPKDAIKEITIGTMATTTPSYFMSNAQNLTTLDFSYAESLTAIGDYFLMGSKFNQPLALPDTLTSIGMYFLVNSSFNQPLTLPNAVTSIGDNFFSGTSFNQPLVLSSALTTIGNSFLYYTPFNQPLTLPNGLTTIGFSFLDYATSFNQPLTLPDSLTSIGFKFLASCNSLTSTINLGNCPASITHGSSDDGSTLAVTKASFPAYTTGITIVGTYAADWKAKFPDSGSKRVYRKLIIG